MDKVTFVIIEDEEHAVIEREDGSFTSMPKSVYDTLASESQAPAAPTA